MRKRLAGYFVIAGSIQILAACSADPAPAPAPMATPPSVSDALDPPSPPVEQPVSHVSESAAPYPPPSSNIALSAEELEICKARAARPNAGAITHADAELALVDVRDVLVNEMSSTPAPGAAESHFVYDFTLTFTFRPTRDGKDEHWAYQKIEIMRDSATAVDQPFSIGRHEELPYLSTITGVGCGQSGDYESCGSFSSQGLPTLNLTVTSRTDEQIDGELEMPDATTGKTLHVGFQALLHAPKEPGDGKSICCVNP